MDLDLSERVTGYILISQRDNTLKSYPTEMEMCATLRKRFFPILIERLLFTLANGPITQAALFNIQGLTTAKSKMPLGLFDVDKFLVPLNPLVITSQVTFSRTSRSVKVHSVVWPRSSSFSAKGG
jgi:hypothetical protein